MMPTISFSVAPFSFCPQSFAPSGSFPMSQLFASGGQSTGVSASLTRLREKGKWVWHPTVGDMVAECFCSEFLFLRWRRYDSETELMKKYPCQTNPQEDFFLSFFFFRKISNDITPWCFDIVTISFVPGLPKKPPNHLPASSFSPWNGQSDLLKKKKKKKIRLHHSPLKSCNYI